MDQFIEQDCLEYLGKIDLSPLRGKTVYVTGANGLIGTYLIYLLHLANITQSAGIRIVAVSKSPPSEALREIFEDRHAFYPMDLADPGAYSLPEKADFIIHGATYAQPGKFLKNALGTIHLNTVATERLLRKAKQDGAGFLFLSSSEIYGEPDEKFIPTPEDYPGLCSPVTVRSVYSESKRMGETLCFAYRSFEGVDAKIARISMSYGPGTGPGDERVLSVFLNQAFRDRRIVMLDDGGKRRTFCYIADCVLVLLNILLYGKELVYNVGGNDTVSIRELAQEICALTGSVLEAAPSQALSSADVMVSPKLVALDIKKIQREFQLPAFKPLHEGLIRTVAWNLARYHAESEAAVSREIIDSHTIK